MAEPTSILGPSPRGCHTKNRLPDGRRRMTGLALGLGTAKGVGENWGAGCSLGLQLHCPRWTALVLKVVAGPGVRSVVHVPKERRRGKSLVVGGGRRTAPAVVVQTRGREPVGVRGLDTGPVGASESLLPLKMAFFTRVGIAVENGGLTLAGERQPERGRDPGAHGERTLGGARFWRCGRDKLASRRSDWRAARRSDCRGQWHRPSR